MIETLWSDIRFGIRLLFKNPLFSLIAILSLGIGVGANTAIFSITNELMFRPFPLIKNTEELSWIFSSIRNGTRPISTSYLNYQDYKDQNHVFSGIAAFSGVPLSITSKGQAELVTGEIVSANYFSVLGVEPSLGRAFLPEEDLKPGANPIIVISDGLWNRRFNGEISVLGQSIILNGLSFTIVGVAPKGFVGVEFGSLPEIWVPMSMHERLVLPAERSLESGSPRLFENRKEGWLNLIGRRKPGISPEQAQAELKGLAYNLAQAHPDTNKDVSVTLYSLIGGLDPLERQDFLPLAGVLMGVVGIVLLIVCNNLASLLLARASARQKEIGIRLSLGAGRGRLVRQLLTESMVIGIGGGATGLLLAYLTRDLVLVSTGVPITTRLDSRVLLFTLIFSLVAVVAFGLAPALQASQANPVTALKESLGTTDRTRHRLRNSLIIGQITLSLMMLICAGLFLRSIGKAGDVDTGFYTKQGLIVPLDLALQNYSEAKGKEFYRQLVERISALPGVQSVGLTEYVPLDVATFGQAIVTPEGQTPRPEDMDAFRVGANTVSPNYFQTMGIPILQGRTFDRRDNDGASKVAIVNENMARRFWPDNGAIGQRFSLSGAKGPYYEVVGIAKNGSYRILGEKPQPYLYTVSTQKYVPNMDLVVRTANDPASVLGVVRAEIQSLDSNLPLTKIKSVTQLVSQSLLPVRMAALLLGIFGLLALILAAAGIYGVTACVVSQRTREIGIRLALGAQRRDILKLIIRESMVTVAVGIGLGLILGFSASQVIRSFIFGILPADIVTFAVVSLILIGVTLLACYVPARRAMQISPIIALKSE